VSDPRTYPSRPFLAVSAAIVREGRVLIVQRARRPANGLHTFPGGVVEAGETLHEAVIREVREETSIAVTPRILAGHREMIWRDSDGRVERHFVVLSFASEWVSGEFTASDELAAGQWLYPRDLSGLKMTDGLAEIAAKALDLIGG
jgi:ADP-ribose pyrophosphatase YjhB (NUDIX family)